MLPERDIKIYGGKGAILNHVRDNLPDMSIPPYVIKQYGQPLDSVLPQFAKMKKPVIFRSSSPHEYGDFEGIFDSLKGVETVDELERAVRFVENSAMSPLAVEYARQNGFVIDEEMHVIIQEESPSKCAGTMMRHPNNPDVIFMHTTSGNPFSRNHSRFALNERTRRDAKITGTYSKGITKDDALRLAEPYRAIEGLTEIANDYSLFVEFGYPGFVFYQARPFKRKCTADFPISQSISPLKLYTDFVFGVTPPEGVVMPVTKSTSLVHLNGLVNDFNERYKNAEHYGNGLADFNVEEMDAFECLVMNASIKGLHCLSRDGFERIATDRLIAWHDEIEEFMEGRKYCLLTDAAHREGYDVDLTLPNMRGLAIYETTNFMAHNLLRLFKRADLVVGNVPILSGTFFDSARCFSDSVRITSNGREATIELLR
jgi:hypothetical protein